MTNISQKCKKCFRYHVKKSQSYKQFPKGEEWTNIQFKLESKCKTSSVRLLSSIGMVYSPRSGVYNKMVQYLSEVA